MVTTARRFDHDVLLLTADEGPAGLRRIDASALVDGLILMDVELHDDRIPLLRELERPSVLIGFPADPTGLTCVDLDFAPAGAACVGAPGRARPPRHRAARRPGGRLRAGHRLRPAHHGRFPGRGALLRRAGPLDPCEEGGPQVAAAR